jgi:hypothetical protein
MAAKIRVFVISYYLPCGTKVWCKEALPKKAAVALGRKLAVSGYRPEVHRLAFLPSELISSSSSRRQLRISSSSLLPKIVE